MTEERMALNEAIQKADDGNFLRALAKTVLQIIMDADVEMLPGAANCLVAERCWDRVRWAIKESAWRFDGCRRLPRGRGTI